MAAKGKTTSVKIVGLSDLYRKLDRLSDHIVGPPARRFMQRATDIVQASAVKKAPNYRGFLRASIKTEIDAAAMPRWGKVGTDTSTKAYAKAIEFGSKPHWPPPGPLARWMHLKGMNPGRPNPNGGYSSNEYLVARKIARYGTKAQPFLTPALTRNKGRIRALLPHMAREIETAAGAMR